MEIKDKLKETIDYSEFKGLSENQIQILLNLKIIELLEKILKKK